MFLLLSSILPCAWFDRGTATQFFGDQWGLHGNNSAVQKTLPYLLDFAVGEVDGLSLRSLGGISIIHTESCNVACVHCGHDHR
jgi:hypothetical protein